MRYREILAEEPLNFDLLNDDEFREWFKGSKVIKRGLPRVMYHGTGIEFEDFLPNSHFGTALAARHRINDRWPLLGSQTRPVYLSIKRPLKVSDIEASEESSFLNSICKGKYPKIDPRIARYDGAYSAAKQAGYDGLVYRNAQEDKGNLSWVPFDPNQIRSAITGK